MFIWLKKSIGRKITLLFIILILGCIAATYYFWEMDVNYPAKYILLGAAALFVFFLLVVHTNIIHPLKKIIEQMKYLLTGRSYKQIYTTRIDELGLIAEFFNDVTQNLEDVSNKLKEQQRMSSELELASEIQNKLLPKETPQIPGLEIVTKNRSAAEIGGDSYDYISRKDSTIFYLGDVTGHGAPAALVMMMVNALINTYSEIHPELIDIVVNTNRQLKPRIKSAMFMSMVALKWDHLKQKMTWVGSGHEYIYIYRAQTGKIEEIKTGGIALGMVPDNSKLVKETELPLDKGDCVILYTDGITEARNASDEMFGEDRLKQSIKKYAAQYGPEGIAHHTAMDFSQFVGDAEQLDDITLMVFRHTGPNSSDKEQK